MLPFQPNNAPTNTKKVTKRTDFRKFRQQMMLKKRAEKAKVIKMPESCCLVLPLVCALSSKYGFECQKQYLKTGLKKTLIMTSFMFTYDVIFAFYFLVFTYYDATFMR